MAATLSLLTLLKAILDNVCILCGQPPHPFLRSLPIFYSSLKCGGLWVAFLERGLVGRFWSLLLDSGPIHFIIKESGQVPFMFVTLTFVLNTTTDYSSEVLF